MPEPAQILTEWTKARPRPAHLSFAAMLGRMLWNHRRNETLFLVSCAERLVDAPSDHGAKEIRKRLARDLGAPEGVPRFRLVFVRREGTWIVKTVEYASPAFALAP